MRLCHHAFGMMFPGGRIRSDILDLKWELGALERAAFAARLVGLVLELNAVILITPSPSKRVSVRGSAASAAAHARGFLRSCPRNRPAARHP